jgi:LacI family transcriptional regulator
VEATIALADHLVALGHRRFAVLAGPQSTITGRERLDAFRRGLAAHGIELAEGDMLIGDFMQESGERAMDELLARPRLPSALFAADNPMALGALRRIRSAGLSIPRDIAVDSFDDPAWFALSDPPMTAVAQPTVEIARTAVSMLRSMVRARRSRA